LTTAQNTREWTAIHRKHHAKCETVDDPHSPVIKGLSTVLRKGAELYRAEAETPRPCASTARTARKTGSSATSTPRSHCWAGIMAVIDLLLFGTIGITIWACR
jgi:fatty-acid desaturase